MVYSRASQVPKKYENRIRESFAKAGVDYSNFKAVDNSCSDLKQPPSVLRAEFAKRLFITEEQQLQEALTSARNTASNAILMGEEEAQTAVKELEKTISDFEGVVEKDVELVSESQLSIYIINVLHSLQGRLHKMTRTRRLI